LSSVSLDELSVGEKQERAFDLSMSALLGEGLYNFGELVFSINVAFASYPELLGEYSSCLVATIITVLQFWGHGWIR
jgi:hypothetical protein